MTIGILKCGEPPEALRQTFGPYENMIHRLLGEDRKAVTFDVQNGVLPDDASACRAYVLTGSSAGVYDDLPWIAPLIDFLRRARGQAKFVGICFGHQAMAEAFGGKVIKSPKGWGIGLHRYDVKARAGWMDEAQAVQVPASHQDQVVEPPPGAQVTIASTFTPYAGFDYGDAISFQCHPEFSPDFAVGLIESRRARYGAMADAAIASYDAPNDCARLGGWIRQFLDQR